MMAMGAVEAAESAQQNQRTGICVDALPEALALVKSGAMAGTVLNDANNWAKPPSIWRKPLTVKVRQMMALTGKLRTRLFAFRT